MKKLISAILMAGIVITGCQEKKEEKTSSKSSVSQTVSGSAEVMKKNKQIVSEKPQEEKAKETTNSTSIDGRQLFTAKGCSGCHQEAVDTVGPSIKKIAAAYKGKKDELIKFLKGEGKPHVDPAKFGIMQPQLNTTKALSDEERNALVDFILSH